jgi:hypothetical protein
MNDLERKLDSVRRQAIAGGLPVQRRDRDLYSILSACLEICEEVQRDGLEKQLREYVRVSVAGTGLSVDEARKGRRYAYPSSDAYVLVCRCVLGSETMQLRSKYAHALREAARRQISWRDLSEWLRNNGGVLALYNSRPGVGKRGGGVRVLHLTTAIDPCKDGKPFTITLRNTGDGFFEVLGD